jgi:hypothetical protein
MLEFGIGKNGFGSLYKNHVNKVFGLDIYDYSALHPGVDFILSDGKEIPLPDESVNLVVSHSVLLRKIIFSVNKPAECGLNYCPLLVSFCLSLSEDFFSKP